MNKKMTLKKARLLADLTQMQVAKKLKICCATLTNIETKKHIPRADLFMSMCKLYGVVCEDVEL